MSLLNAEMSFDRMTKFCFIPKTRIYNCPLGSSLSKGLGTGSRQSLINQHHLECIKIIPSSPPSFLSLYLPTSNFYIPRAYNDTCYSWLKLNGAVGSSRSGFEL